MADWFDLSGHYIRGPSEMNVFNYDRLVFRDHESLYTVDIGQLTKAKESLGSVEKPEVLDWYVWIMKYKIVMYAVL